MSRQSENPDQSRALAIPEIVTSILRQMDMRTLITAQSICHTWKDLICNTQSLQEVLFFRPISHGLDTRTRVNNPLLSEVFPSFFTSQDSEDADATSQVSYRGHFICLVDLAWEKRSAVREIFIRPEASWRRMLTHQPPFYLVGGFTSSCSPFGFRCSQSKAIQKDGLRMAPLFEWLIDRDSWHWTDEMSISILFPASLPVGALEQSTTRNWERPALARKETMGDFDIVLEVNYTDDNDEQEKEQNKEARKEGEEIADTDLIVWERICRCYRALGLTMNGLQMVEYIKEKGIWD